MEIKNKKMDIKNFLLEQTCLACPEQYDIYYDGKYIGWIKLRWGILRLMNCQNVTIYRHDFQNEYKGSFDDSADRFDWLTKILDDNFAILMRFEL